MKHLDSKYLLDIALNIIGQNRLDWHRIFEPVETRVHHPVLFGSELWKQAFEFTIDLSGEALGRIAEYAGNLYNTHDPEHFLGSKAFYFATTVNEVEGSESMRISYSCDEITPLRRLAVLTLVAAMYDILFRDMIRAQYIRRDGRYLTKEDVDLLVHDRAAGHREAKFIDEYTHLKRR